VSYEVQRWAGRLDTVPDTVALIIWLIAGVAGGNAAGELLKGDYDLGPGNTVAGAIGGVVGTGILQILIPALRGFDVGPILRQAVTAAVIGAVTTVIAGVVRSRRHHGRR
jgi:CDP-diglyceride synthetase